MPGVGLGAAKGARVGEADEAIGLVAERGEAEAEEEREGDHAQDVHAGRRRDHVVGHGRARDAQQRLYWRPAARRSLHRLLAVVKRIRCEHLHSNSGGPATLQVLLDIHWSVTVVHCLSLDPSTI